MKNKKKVVIIVSVCLAVLALLACLWFFWLKNVVGAAGKDPAYVTSVASITGMETGMAPRYSGVVEPQKTVKVNKDDSKTVAEIYVAEGDEVEEGTALFRYDTEEMQLSLDQAELELEGIATKITTLKNQLATLEKEKKNASKDDELSYTIKIQSTQLEIKNEEYNSSVKKNEIEKLKTSLENADVVAEAAGVVKEINITPKTDSMGNQLPFMSILMTGDFRIKGTVTELNLSSLAEGQAVIVHSRVDKTVTWKGSVESIDFENPVDNQNNGGAVYYGGGDTGAVKATKYNFYVKLDNPEGLILGQHVYLEPDAGATNAKEGLWLPAFYVAHDDSGSFVWVRNDKEKLEKRTVILGDYDSDNDTYQIQSGLTAEDYIAYPNETLSEGQPTTVDPYAAQSSNPTGDEPMGGALPGEPGGSPEDGLPVDGGDGGVYDENGNPVTDENGLPIDGEGGLPEEDGTSSFSLSDDGEEGGTGGTMQ